MKILHCIESIDPKFGGPVEAIRQFAKASMGLRARDVQAEVVTLDDDISLWEHAWPVPVHAIPGAKSPYRFNAALPQWLRTHHAEYDAVVVHGIFRYHLIGAWQGLKGTSTPYFVMVHGMLNPWFKEQYRLNHIRKSLFWYPLIKPALRNAKATIFLVEEERRLAQQSFDIADLPYVVLPLGVADPLASKNSIPSLKDKLKSATFLFFGRICDMKGCDLLLRAFSTIVAQTPNARLVFAGPDNERIQSRLKLLSSSLGLDGHVSWLGPVYGDSKWKLLADADAFVLPSHCETFPVAVIEALAVGLPVIISDKVNLWPYVRQSDGGIVCSDDVESTAAALKRWLGMSNLQQNAMRKNARACYLKNFELHAALKKHQDYLHCTRPQSQLAV